MNYLKKGDEIGIAAFVETPVDDWGVDVSPRGALSLVTGVEEMEQDVPRTFVLENNYPNPFNPETHIDYTVPKTAEVKIEIYNALGQRVRTLVDKKLSAGQHSVVWDARDDSGIQVSSGVYFYVLRSDGIRLTKKMSLLK